MRLVILLVLVSGCGSRQASRAAECVGIAFLKAAALGVGTAVAQGIAAATADLEIEAAESARSSDEVRRWRCLPRVTPAEPSAVFTVRPVRRARRAS